jgi:acetylornithine aminotransferase
MLEPIQGESGVIIPSNNYLSDVQTICNNNDWLFILDEVQTGIGRTGELFAHQHSNITPDVMTLAKGLGNGVPIGACLTKGPANKMLTPGTHGSTFGGNPLVSKVALGVLDIFHKDNILDNVKTRSEQISTQLNNALKGNVKVKEIRIKGLMIAIELNADCSTLLQSALEDHLLINITGNSIRMLPPLVINQQEVDIMLEKVIKLINNTSE